MPRIHSTLSYAGVIYKPVIIYYLLNKLPEELIDKIFSMFDPVDAVNNYYYMKYRIRELLLYKYPSMYLQNTNIFSKNDANIIIKNFNGIKFQKVYKQALINSENENVKQQNIIIPTENVINNKYGKSRKMSKNKYYRRNRNNHQKYELHKNNIKDKYNKKLHKLLKKENRMTKSINNDDLLYYIYHDIPNIVNYCYGFCYINDDYYDRNGDYIDSYYCYNYEEDYDYDYYDYDYFY